MRASFVSNKPVLSCDEIKRFHEKYLLTEDLQKNCGEIILGIMKKKGMSVSEAMKKSGLNAYIFSGFKDPKKTISKYMLISMSMALGLDTKDTECILESNGMCFYSNSIVDKAYITLIEEHKGEDIENCNIILKQLGVEEKWFLGAHERGEYKPRKE